MLAPFKRNIATLLSVEIYSKHYKRRVAYSTPNMLLDTDYTRIKGKSIETFVLLGIGLASREDIL